MSELVKEGTYYGPVFFQEPEDSGRVDIYGNSKAGACTLLLKHYRLTRTARGHLRLNQRSEGVDFPDEGAMQDAIEEGGWIGLPAEAQEGGRFARYVPEEFQTP